MVQIKYKSSIPRIMIAAAGSNSGKTTITTAILKAYSRANKKIAAYKSGPDYIDPMFHSQVVKIPSRNLDVFMLGENNCKYILGETSKNMDLSIIEGVMGFYDGIGKGSSYSSYELSKLLGCPVVLVINPNGMAASVSAMIMGFKNFKENSNIKGVILNNISRKMYDFYKNIIESNTGVKVYGYMPHIEKCELKSRHLGLVTAMEIGDLETVVDKLGAQAVETVDLEGLYELAKSSDDFEYDKLEINSIGNIRIAVAQDEAFCFYYRDSLDLLEKLGAELVSFSPLNDNQLPSDISGLYVGGGYPELYLDRLSQNNSMLEELKEKIDSGLPTFAECGGYMYMMKSLKDLDGREHNLVGAIEGQSFMKKSLHNFGYVKLTAQQDNLMCKKHQSINGHEFHYSDSTNLGDSFIAVKPESDKNWSCIISDNTKFMGYPHINLLGNIEFAKNFVKKCTEYKEREI